MNDPFYEEVRTEYVYHPRSVREIFDHIQKKMIEYNEYWQQAPFSANERMNDAIAEFRAKNMTIEELMLNI